MASFLASGKDNVRGGKKKIKDKRSAGRGGGYGQSAHKIKCSSNSKRTKEIIFACGMENFRTDQHHIPYYYTILVF